MYLIKMRNAKRKHIVYDPSSISTVCGKKIKSGEIMDMLPKDEKWNLCQKCYAFIGEEMVDAFFGMDFYDS